MKSPRSSSASLRASSVSRLDGGLGDKPGLVGVGEHDLLDVGHPVEPVRDPIHHQAGFKRDLAGLAQIREKPAELRGKRVVDSALQHGLSCFILGAGLSILLVAVESNVEHGILSGLGLAFQRMYTEADPLSFHALLTPAATPPRSLFSITCFGH